VRSRVRSLRGLIEWTWRKHVLRQRYQIRHIHDYVMYLDHGVPGVSRPLAIHGSREEDKTELLRRELEPGMIHLDLGANIGYYALFAARRVGPRGKVICIEPDPRNLDLLRRNVSVNGFGDYVEIHAVAASDTEGHATMYKASASNLNTLVEPSAAMAARRHETQVNVETVTIDSLMETRGGRLNFLRMDIEGYEVDALRGGLKTLAASPPPCKILLETHAQMYGPNRDFGAVLRQLFSLGFFAKGLVSAGADRPEAFRRLGYQPRESFFADGYKRGYYEGVSPADVIQLCTAMPKAVRYLLLCKA
jgi:FkbM family methyltransferase